MQITFTNLGVINRLYIVHPWYHIEICYNLCKEICLRVLCVLFDHRP